MKAHHTVPREIRFDDEKESTICHDVAAERRGNISEVWSPRCLLDIPIDVLDVTCLSGLSSSQKLDV